MGFSVETEMEIREGHSVKTSYSILVTLFGMLMDFRQVHFFKASLPILVTLLGIVMVDNLVLP